MIGRSSLFAQVLGRISRRDFRMAVRRHNGEKGAKGFSCWDQFVAMLYAQVAGAHSLREICGGLASAVGKITHLGIAKAPARSTLAYANARRSWRVFEAVFYSLLARGQALAAREKRKFRFKNPLMSLDATVIDLCAEVFDWARFRRTKGAVKLHLMLDHHGCLPCWALVTEGAVHEINAARTLRFAPGMSLPGNRQPSINTDAISSARLSAGSGGISKSPRRECSCGRRYLPSTPTWARWTSACG